MEHQTECLQLKLKERENAIEQLTEQCSQLVIARDVMVLKQQEIDQTPHGGHEKTNLEVLVRHLEPNYLSFLSLT